MHGVLRKRETSKLQSLLVFVYIGAEDCQTSSEESGIHIQKTEPFPFPSEITPIAP